jgi:hypothetical protein
VELFFRLDFLSPFPPLALLGEVGRRLGAGVGGRDVGAFFCFFTV